MPEEGPLRGPMPFFVWKGEPSARAIPASGSAVRSRERVFFPLSTRRVRLGPQPLVRSGGASSQETVLHASGGRRCASLRGPAHRSSSARASPRAPSPSALGGRRPRPLSPAPAAACLCCFLSLALPLSACSSRLCLEVESPSPRRVARTCSGPGSSPGVHRPPQVAESSAENEPAPPPPAPSSGCGGRGSRRAAAVAAAARGRGWLGCSLAGLGAEDQQIQLAQGRLGDGEPCTRRGAREPQQRSARRSLPCLCPGTVRGAPGAATSRCPAPSPSLGPGSSPGLAGARSLFAELPARQSCPLLRSGTTDRRGRPLLPLRLAPGPPPASRPNQLQPRGGYHGDAAPRPPRGGAGGRHARFSRQNSKAGRAALQPLSPSWDEVDPAPGGLQLPTCCEPKTGEGVLIGSAKHAGCCSPFVEVLGLKSR